MGRTTLQERIILAMEWAKIPTPAALARKMGVNRQTVHRWYKGEGLNLELEMLVKLADALNVTIRWLATGKGNPREEFSPEARQIAVNIDSMEDSKRRENALKIARLATEETAPNAPVTKALYGKHTDRLIGRYTTPTLWNEDDHADVPKGGKR